MNRQKSKFSIITGKTVHDTIFFDSKKIIEIVKRTYIQHFHGETVNPHSSFLNFPKNLDARIISLPAYIGGSNPISGLKWIASYPSNIKHNIPRASATLILNDPDTGYPLACLEASIISAARTAASAVLGAYYIKQEKPTISCLGIIGTGMIASYVLEFFMQTNWNIDQIYLYDLNSKYAQNFSTKKEQIKDCKVRVGNTLEEVIQNSDMIVLTTTASTPHVSNPNILKHTPTILNLSLRDLSPEIIVNSYNVVDDVEHVLQANTSLHLAEKQYGHRNFIDATLPDILANNKKIITPKTIIFSPFGMGILDIAVGQYIYETTTRNNTSIEINDFFFQADKNVTKDRLL